MIHVTPLRLALAASIAGAAPSFVHAADVPVTITEAGQQAMLSPGEIAQLPATKVSAMVGPPPGHTVTFEGPMLWALLEHAHAAAPGQHAAPVREWVLVTGSDGFTAALGMAEIAPEFEAKPVILALSADGKPLEPGHYSLIVPGDQRRGRSVHDVASITVDAAPAKP